MVDNFRSFNDNYPLELDFEPFNANFPRPNRSSSIGNGVQFLNRHLSSIMFRNKESLEPLLNFLRAHKYKGHVSVAFCATFTLCFALDVVALRCLLLNLVLVLSLVGDDAE